MNSILICAVIGWMILIVGFSLVINIMLSKNGGDMLSRICGIALIIAFTGIFSLMFLDESFTRMYDVSLISYQRPTSIVKTNNLTLVHYIQDEKVIIDLVSKGTDFWNSDGIAIKVSHGVNLYGKKVNDIYEIVAKQGE